MEKIVVGLSGGVDSAVAALLLQREGYEVVGVTLRVHNEADAELADAAKIADKLGIEHRITDMTRPFADVVISYFADAYENGRTPNPCLVCNPKIKWQALLSVADEVGAKLVATGHYAGIRKLENGRYAISCAASQAKDQAYVLYGLTQEQLQRTVMPLTSYEKDTVRQIAENVGIPVAHKADSMEICFLPEGISYADYIIQRTGQVPQAGNFVDEDGKVLGRHKGVLYYTVGQRKGLGIAFGEPRYVKRLDAEKNEVILSDGDALFQKTVYMKDYLGMACEEPQDGDCFLGKVRYSHKGDTCRVYREKDLFRCEFDRPQRAPTPGQALVLYREDCVAGGGIIVAEP